MATTVTWLGHATVVLDLDDTRILTDPLLGRHAGPLRRRGPGPTRGSWEGADAMLLSHLHHDHAELRSLRMLPAGVPVITSAQNAHWLRRRDLTGVTPTESGWLRVGRRPGVRIALCRAVHNARPMPHRPNEANGFLLRSASATIWFAGDTELYDGLERLPEEAGAPIDLALVGISGWAPRLSSGHTGPVQAAQACARVGARWVVPVHWGTFHTPGGRSYPRGWMDRPAETFTRALAEVAPGCEPLLLAPGGQTTLRHATDTL